MATSADASLSRLFDTHKQRADRVAQRRRLDKPLEIVKQRCVCFGQGSRAAAFTANLARSKWRRIEVLQSTSDGAARQPRDARHRRQTAPSGGARFARRKQPTTAFVPFRTVRFPTLPNRPPIDHAIAGSALRRAEESPAPESQGRMAIHGRSQFTYRWGCPQRHRSKPSRDRECVETPRCHGLLKLLSSHRSQLGTSTDKTLPASIPGGGPFSCATLAPSEKCPARTRYLRRRRRWRGCFNRGQAEGGDRDHHCDGADS